jgi:hypothetical protein
MHLSHDLIFQLRMEIVVTLSLQLSWSYFTAIIPLKDNLQQEFYAEMYQIERWSIRMLRQKIRNS